MKKMAKIACLIFSIGLYSLIVTFSSSTNVYQAEAYGKNIPSEKMLYISGASNLFSNAIQPELAIKWGGSAHSISLKVSPSITIACARIVELQLATAITKYRFYSTSITNRFSPPNIIFPFNYFW